MVKNKNDYYTKTINNFYQGKDSVLEMAKIITYDQKKLVADVFTMTSKKYVKGVPILFPTVNFNYGIIAPPSLNSTSLLFWGPDRQPLILPMQLNVPNVSVQNGVQQVNVSPGYLDALMTLENIQPGEFLFRSQGGSYLFLKNNGILELGTSSLHRLTLDESTGLMEMMVEQLNIGVGTNQIYLGPTSRLSNADTRTHFSIDLKETTDETELLPPIDDVTLLDQTLNKNIDYIALGDVPSIMKEQIIHVFDDQGNIVTDLQDGSDLFSQKIITKDSVTVTEQLSKAGRRYFKTENSIGSIEVSISPTDAVVTRTTIIDGVQKNTHVELTSDGKILVGDETATYDLLPMLKWFYTQGAGA